MRADCFIYMSDLATPGSHATKRPSPPPARRSSTPPLPGSDQEVLQPTRTVLAWPVPFAEFACRRQYFRRCIMGDYSNVDKNCCGISAKFKVPFHFAPHFVGGSCCPALCVQDRVGLLRVARILQNLKSCGLSAPRSHEFPSSTAAGAPAAAPAPRAPPPGGPPRILHNTPRECSCSTNNYTHACHSFCVTC